MNKCKNTECPLGNYSEKILIGCTSYALIDLPSCAYLKTIDDEAYEEDIVPVVDECDKILKTYRQELRAVERLRRIENGRLIITNKIGVN